MEDRTITLVAKQPLTYAGRDFQAGDVFSAAPIDAAVLTYKRRAKFADKDGKPVPDGTFCPNAEGHLGDLGPPGEPGAGIDTCAQETPPARTRRRRYRTRQLKAEE